MSSTSQNCQDRRHAARRSYIYRALVDRGYRKERMNKTRPASLPAKIGRFTNAQGGATHFLGNAKKVATGVTPAVWNTQLQLMYNALPFEARRNKANMDIADRVRRCFPERTQADPEPSERTETIEVCADTACYYCGAGPDSADHVYTECEVVREAHKQWGTKLGCRFKNDWTEILLAFPPVDNPVVAPGIVGFNYAVWSERSEYLPTLGYVPEKGSSVRRMLLQAGARLPVEKENRGAKAEKKVADFARNPPGEKKHGTTSQMALPWGTRARVAEAMWSGLQVKTTTRKLPSRMVMAITTKGKWGASKPGS